MQMHNQFTATHVTLFFLQEAQEEEEEEEEEMEMLVGQEEAGANGGRRRRKGKGMAAARGRMSRTNSSGNQMLDHLLADIRNKFVSHAEEVSE